MSPGPRAPGTPAAGTGAGGREEGGEESVLRMADVDIRQVGRFTREFVTMSLVPWMEKCVVEWNENVRSGLVFHACSY